MGLRSSLLLNDSLYAVVSASGMNTRADLDALTSEVRRVHISGSPSKGLLEQIITRCPFLSVLEITDCIMARIKVGGGYSFVIRFCISHGILLTDKKLGSVAKPPRVSVFTRQRQVILEHKELFNEYLSRGMLAARIAARYYCLNGEKRISFSQCDGPSYPRSKSSARTRVIMLLKHLATGPDESLKEFKGLVPYNLKADQHVSFQKFMRLVQNSCRFFTFFGSRPRECLVLMLRLGYTPQCECWTRAEIAKYFKTNWPYIEQLEIRAVDLMNQIPM